MQDIGDVAEATTVTNTSLHIDHQSVCALLSGIVTEYESTPGVDDTDAHIDDNAIPSFLDKAIDLYCAYFETIPACPCACHGSVTSLLLNVFGLLGIDPGRNLAVRDHLRVIVSTGWLCRLVACKILVRMKGIESILPSSVLSIIKSVPLVSRLDPHLSKVLSSVSVTPNSKTVSSLGTWSTPLAQQLQTPSYASAVSSKTPKSAPTPNVWTSRMVNQNLTGANITVSPDVCNVPFLTILTPMLSRMLKYVCHAMSIYDRTTVDAKPKKYTNLQNNLYYNREKIRDGFFLLMLQYNTTLDAITSDPNVWHDFVSRVFELYSMLDVSNSYWFADHLTSLYVISGSSKINISSNYNAEYPTLGNDKNKGGSALLTTSERKPQRYTGRPSRDTDKVSAWMSHALTSSPMLFWESYYSAVLAITDSYSLVHHVADVVIMRCTSLLSLDRSPDSMACLLVMCRLMSCVYYMPYWTSSPPLTQIPFSADDRLPRMILTHIRQGSADNIEACDSRSECLLIEMLAGGVSHPNFWSSLYESPPSSLLHCLIQCLVYGVVHDTLELACPCVCALLSASYPAVSVLASVPEMSLLTHLLRECRCLLLRRMSCNINNDTVNCMILCCIGWLDPVISTFPNDAPEDNIRTLTSRLSPCRYVGGRKSMLSVIDTQEIWQVCPHLDSVRMTLGRLVNNELKRGRAKRARRVQPVILSSSSSTAVEIVKEHIETDAHLAQAESLDERQEEIVEHDDVIHVHDGDNDSVWSEDGDML